MSSETSGISVLNEQSIKESLLQDPLLFRNKSGDSVDSNSNELLSFESVMNKDTALVAELHDLNSLKQISDLILEFNANWEYIEVENCYYSLLNLRKKLKQNDTVLAKQNIRFQQSVITYVESLHLKLIEKVSDLLTEKFWNITSNSVVYNASVELNNVKFEYKPFLEFLSNELIIENDNILDLNNWFIKDMSLGELHNMVRNKMKIILNDYLHFELLLNKLKEALFNSNMKFDYDVNNRKLSWEENYHDVKSKDKLESLTNIVNYMNTELSELNSKLIEKLSPLVANEFTKLVKGNISEIVQNENLSTTVLTLNESINNLKSFTQTASWYFDTAVINDLLKSKEVYNNLILDQILESHLEQLRNIFKNKHSNTKWNELSECDIGKIAMKNNASIAKTEKSTKDIINLNKEDDWDWNDGNDGWDNEIDAGSLNSTPKIPNDNTWDEAWDVEVDVEIDDEENTSANQATNLHSIFVTQLPSLFINIACSFQKEAEKISENITTEEYFKFKFNVLQTALLAIAQVHYSGKWWQLFIDIRYIINSDQKFQRLEELNLRFIDNHLNMEKKQVYNIVTSLLSSLDSDENIKYASKEINHLLGMIKKNIFIPLCKIKGLEHDSNVLQFIHFFYFECIVNTISKWKIISERNSHNLSELISMISTGLEVEQTIRDQPKFREMNEKFVITGKILRSHLKEIMNMFYDGDFYLFSTDEIIQWIVLLFADTPLRRDAINDIRDIRNAQLDED
ncbi:hypothetical protein TPHA_0B04330 [Tetrapisispora phaffii CBS 4417]|uniref:Retrograde transport protein Dsl1 C-terminal domain-containing protein n=1 Tax=Tetrapisispora phaffii (strain ATCC 24235 / CBS 4417 / NBRC 1672 / NRRL Y-8282 / UCD 70-5) TaxID=1071381 RepID=G8BQ21_TETPH|nr:hypothetical protein TPHA_0B04330 [Tetrapisispora phaffii CBS 4417]CCE62102.1 hypothetical protein TPHA_0B04330 [Tetrapisispora phaffii CBS 4417]